MAIELTKARTAPDSYPGFKTRKYLLGRVEAVLVGLLLSCLPAFSEEQIPVAGVHRSGVSQSEFKEPHETVMSLIRTDRAPRERKYLWLVPGQETSHFYRVLQEDGTEIIREADHYLTDPKPRDDRPLKEKSPNKWVAYQVGKFSIAGALWAVTALTSVKN